MNDYTLQGTYKLPSLAKVYDTPFNPEITLRSMTTNEEMKRQNYAERTYQVMAGIIDDCIVDKLPISSYDMCVADYQFLLHKLRTVTYSNLYRVSATCPYCGATTESFIDLNEIELKEFDEETYKKYSEVDLPQSHLHIKLRMQTPRILDDIQLRAKEQRKKTPNLVGDPAFLFTLEALIDRIDGECPDPTQLPIMIRQLPMMDTNYLLKYSQKLMESFGLNSNVTLKCPVCGVEYESSFRITREFFGPSIDV